MSDQCDNSSTSRAHVNIRSGEVDGMSERAGNFDQVLSLSLLPNKDEIEIPTMAEEFSGQSPEGLPSEGNNIEPFEPVKGETSAKEVFAILEQIKDQIDNEIFLYQGSEPSTVYRYQGFKSGLQIMFDTGVAGKFFYLGDDSPNGYLYGLANIAAFLGQSMKETIQYDACDENSVRIMLFTLLNTIQLLLSNNRKRISF